MKEVLKESGLNLQIIFSITFTEYKNFVKKLKRKRIALNMII